MYLSRMFKALKPFLRLLLFWIAFFFIQRLIFVIFHASKFKGIGSTEILWTFIKGIRLDLSVTGYLMALPLLFLLITVLFRRTAGVFNSVIRVYNLILVSLIIVIGAIDLNIYTEWGTKINSRAIEFLVLSPGEALASSSSSPIALSLTIIALNAFAAFYALRKWVKFGYNTSDTQVWKLLALYPVLAFILVIFLRGGLQLAPINQSAAYFSSKPILNHSSVNTEWNLLHSFIENHFSNENPYRYMEEQEAAQTVDVLYTMPGNTTPDLLSTNRPNVVLIILESFTSDVVAAFGGDQEVSPFLSEIAANGIRFEHLYASGDRTDKGMIAIMSGFPTQAVRTIIQQPDKFEKLPSLPERFNKLGYHTSFYYGGELEFANFKSYLLSTGIQKLTDKRDFRPEQMNSKWGAHDGFVLDRLLNDLNTEKEPFFASMLTLSSHEPFEVPIKSRFKGTSLPDQFRKAANYTDICIGEFFAKARREPWFKNTLFVIVADHGHRLPKEYEHAYEPGKFRIPMVFYGDVIKDEYQHTSVSLTGSQTDIAATLLQQLGESSDEFKWSKDLLGKNTKPFAFYSYDNGFGWVEYPHTLSFDNVSRQITSADAGISDSTRLRMENQGKAYMQRVFETYLAY